MLVGEHGILFILGVAMLTPDAAVLGAGGYDLPNAARIRQLTQQKYSGSTGRPDSKKQKLGLPRGHVDETCASTAGGMGSTPGRETGIPHTPW